MFDTLLYWIRKMFSCDCGDNYHDYNDIAVEDDDVISVEDDECNG